MPGEREATSPHPFPTTPGVLADLQGFAPAEIAEMLNVEAVTVRTNLLKARRQIRTIMLAERASLLEEFRS
jgi:hypothetical protein